jgi:hypothetical protein
METIKINGVTFNARVVAKYETAEEFANSKSNQHYWEGIKSESRKQRLITAWNESRKKLKLPTDGNAKTSKESPELKGSKADNKGDNTGDKK